MKDSKLILIGKKIVEIFDLLKSDTKPVEIEKTEVTEKSWNEKIEAEAFKQVGTNEYRNKITHDGKLACAAFVSGVLIDSGAMSGRGEVGQKRLEMRLREQGFEDVNREDIKPGDIVFWDAYPGRFHGHVGVVVLKKYLNTKETLTVIDNSSTNRVPVYRTDWPHKSRPIRCFLRKVK